MIIDKHQAPIFKLLSEDRKQLTVIFLVYLVFAFVLGFAYRFAINPDGVSHLRLAGYIAEGNISQSITSGWSPMLSWSISPLLLIGFDGLTAARICIALFGALLLLNCWLLASRFYLSQNYKLIAMLAAALIISIWTVQFVSSDVIVAALTIGYLYLVTSPGILESKKVSFLCGITGGVAYLAHHYFFPFFLAHFPVMLFIRGFMDRDGKGLQYKKIIVTLGVGVAGFLIIASIWIGIVSMKYGQFTISSKGPIAHAAVGPKDKGHPFFAGGLYKPRDAYAIHVFEDPSDVKFKTWSPFASRENFKHQIYLIKENAIAILDHFVKKSPFFTYAFVIGMLTLFPITYLMLSPNNKYRFLYLWVITTFSIYSSGFLLIIARSPRRFYALMMLFLLMSFFFIERLILKLQDNVQGLRKKMLISYLLLIVIAAFTVKPGMIFVNSIRSIIAGDQVNAYKEIAEQVNTIDFPGPFAIIRSSQKPYTDYYIAYFMEKQLLGRPLSKDVESLGQELRAAGAKSLVVFDSQSVVERLKADSRYIHAGALKLGIDNRYFNAVNTVRDQITGWDEEVNVFKIE